MFNHGVFILDVWEDEMGFSFLNSFAFLPVCRNWPSELVIWLSQSAKTNLNVEDVFFCIARDIKQRLAETDSKPEVVAVFNVLTSRKWDQEVESFAVFFSLSSYSCHPACPQRESSHMWMQAPSIKINKPDPGKPAPGTQRSACCSSWNGSDGGLILADGSTVCVWTWCIERLDAARVTHPTGRGGMQEKAGLLLAHYSQGCSVGCSRM